MNLLNLKKRKLTNLVEIHSAVLLFGVAGLAGKVSLLHPLVIVAGRVIFASLALLIFAGIFRTNLKLANRRDYIFFLIAGIILSMHWFLFFLSIEYSTVAIGLLTYSIFPVVVAFIEPAFNREKIHLMDIIPALAGFAGIIVIIPEFSFHNRYTSGVVWGVLSGVSFAVLAVFNRHFVKKYNSMAISFYEDLAAGIVLVPFLLIYPPVVSGQSLVILVFLGVIFTALAHTLFIEGMKNITARTAGIIANLEPLYGILLASVTINEIPGKRVIAGGVIILAVSFYVTIKSVKNSKMVTDHRLND